VCSNLQLQCRIGSKTEKCGKSDKFVLPRSTMPMRHKEHFASMCCGVLQYVAIYCGALLCTVVYDSVCCRVLLGVVVCCGVLHCVAVRVAVCCTVL